MKSKYIFLFFKKTTTKIKTLKLETHLWLAHFLAHTIPKSPILKLLKNPNLTL